MANYTNLKDLFTAIANAIRSKTGSTEPIVADNFPTAIEAIVEVGDDYVFELNPPNTIKTYTDNISTAIADNQFKDFKELTTVTAPYVYNIGSHAFDGCSKLTALNISAVERVGDYAFNACTSIACIPYEMSFYYPGVGIFANCTNLKIVEYYVCDLLEKTFSGCTNLITLIDRYGSYAPLEYPDALEGTPIANGTGYIYVQSKCLADYAADESWVASGIKFRVLEDYTVDGTVDGELDETKI